jgi:RNA-directed DNA polymerase
LQSVIDISETEARKYFLEATSYFNADFPKYINFQPIIDAVAYILGHKTFSEFQSEQPSILSGVNYQIISNKDGKYAWRPLELIHPVIYVSLVNQICEKSNWNMIRKRLNSFQSDKIFCCSLPVVSSNKNSNSANQISHWWQQVEQKSIKFSLEYNVSLHSDVSDCYGSLYTHSIAWALHGKNESKEFHNKKNKSLIGNIIDFHMQAGRYGQTNGIPQGSVLMDFVAELLLGYVDSLAAPQLADFNIKILRYRDDYRIFAQDEYTAANALKIVSDALRTVGMRLNVGKTALFQNVIESAIKQDKLAGIELSELDVSNAITFQKQLLRIHSFGKKYPNSGALRRLLGEMHGKIVRQNVRPKDLTVQVAIVVDIACMSPTTFPAAVGILSHLISLEKKSEKKDLWSFVADKVRRLPYNGYQEIWLQRVIAAQLASPKFISEEPICRIVDGGVHQLWNSQWLSSKPLLKALDTKKIVIEAANSMVPVVQPEEIALFNKHSEYY